MKKGIGLLLAGAITVSLCGCQKAQAPATEPTETEITEEVISQITEENLIEKIQGWWVTVPEDYNCCYAMKFEGNTCLETLYPGEQFPDGVVQNVTETAPGEFLVEIYYPETVLFGEVWAESTDFDILSSPDNFEATMMLSSESGTVFEFQYAGLAMEDLYRVGDALLEAN